MPYASSIQVINDANGTAYAFLADNGAIWQCQWDAQAEVWAKGQIVPQAFGGEKLQALYLSNLWPSGSSGADNAGSTPGIVLAYRVGEGVGAEVYASFGQWSSDGVLGWSQPQQLTDDQVEDQAFSLAQGEQGGFSLVVQKQQAGVNSTAILDKIKGSSPGQFESALAAATSAERPDSDLYVNQYNLTQTGTLLTPSWQLTSPNGPSKDQPQILWAPREASSAASPLSLSGNTQLSRQQLYPATSTTSSDLADNSTVALMGVSATSSAPPSGWSYQGGAAAQFNSKNGSSLRLGVMPGLDPLRWQLKYPATVVTEDSLDEEDLLYFNRPDLDIDEISNASSDLLNPVDKGGPIEAAISDAAGGVERIADVSKPGGAFKTGTRYVTDTEYAKNHSEFDLFLKGMFGLSNLGQGGPMSISSAKLGFDFGNAGKTGVAMAATKSFDDATSDYLSGKSIGLGGSLRTIYQYDNMNPGHLTGLHAAETISIDLDYTGVKFFPGGSSITVVGAADVGYSWEQSVATESGYLPAWLGYIGWSGGIFADLAKKLAMARGFANYSDIIKGSEGRNLDTREFLLSTSSAKNLGDVEGVHQKAAALIGSSMAALGPATALVVEQSGQGLDGATFENTRGEEIFARLTGRYLWHSLVGLQATVGNQYNANWAGVDKGKWQDTFFAIAGIAFPLGSSISLLNYHHTWTHPKQDNAETTDLGATQSASADSASGGSGFYAGAPSGNDYPFLYTPSTASSSYLAPTTASKSATNPYLLGAKQTENLQFFTLGHYDGPINYTPPKGSSQAKYSNSNIAVTLSNAGNNLNPGNYTKVPLLGVTADGTEASGAYAAFTVDSSGNILASSFQITAAGQYLHLPETEPNSTIYALMPDVFSTGIAIPPDPTASDLGNTFRDLPLITIASTVTGSPLTTQPISRVQEVEVKPANQPAGVIYPNYNPSTKTATPPPADNTSPYTYSNVAVQLLAAPTNDLTSTTAVSLLNLGAITATVHLSAGVIQRVELDQPLLFVPPAGSEQYSVQLTLPEAVITELPLNTTTSFDVDTEQAAFNNFVAEDQFSAQPGAVNAGVYIAAGISDQIPLHASMGSWPVQNRVSYVTNQETVYLNGIKKSAAENGYVSIPVVTQSDLYPNAIYNDSDIFFSAASSPTAITIVGNGSYTNDTFVAWVEASEQVIPNKYKGDGAKSFQDFMDKLYGSQRINFRIQTARGWQNTNLAYLYTPEEPSVIRHLKAFNVERAGSPATLLVWTETSIDAIKGAVAEIGSGESVQTVIKTGWIDATSSSTSSNNSILWNNLVTDIGTIPWDPSTDVGLAINDITIGSLPYLQSDGSIVESPLVSWSQDVRTPYRQSVLNDDPLLYLQFGDLQSGYNAINIGSVKDPTTTGTQASSTGLIAIAGALSKSQASAVQNIDGTGVISTGLGTMYASIREIVNNIPANSNNLGVYPISTFSGTISGTQLTVTGVFSGRLRVGDVISGPGILSGTTITSDYKIVSGRHVYSISQSQELDEVTTLEAITAPSEVPHSSFSGAITGTTLTVSAISQGLLQLGDQLIGEGVAPGTFISAVNTFDANQGTGTYTVSIEQTLPDSALLAIPGQPTTPYTIEFWAQLAPGSNKEGAGLVAFGQPSSSAVGAATTPDGWLLSSSFVVDYITYQQAAAQSLIPAIPTGKDPSDLYGWAWGVVADGANTTAMNGTGGSNLYSNALQINNLVSGASLAGINQFLANYQLTSSDLLGIDNTTADTIAAVPTTQLQFDHTLDSGGQPVSSLNNIAIDTSSALLNQGFVLASDLISDISNLPVNPTASNLSKMFGALWDFQQKTGEAKVNLTLSPDSNKSTTTTDGQLPNGYTSEQYSGYELDFSLQNGVAVSVNGSGQLVFDFGNNKSITTNLEDLPDLRDNQWHYIAATYLPTYQAYDIRGTVAQLPTNVGTASLYVDNKLAASQSNVFNAYAPINFNDQALLLANNVKGAIDQFAFYDKALTPSTFTPNASGQWPMPTTDDALALLAAMGYGIDTKTPDPGAIPGAVSSHWNARNVNPNDALLGTYYSVFTPDTTVAGAGSWSQASNLNPSLAPQATIPSASRPGSLQNDLVISVPVANWTQNDWLLNNATTATVFNPAGEKLISVSVTLTNASDATDTSTVTLSPEQVLLGSNSLLSLQPQSTSSSNGFQYIVPTNLPAFNLVLDKDNLSSNQEYKATYTFTFSTTTTTPVTTTVTSKTPITINATGSALGNSFNTGVISADGLKRVETFSSAIATAAVIEQAPLQLKYIDSGEVFKSASSLAAANSPASSSPANSFGQSQVYGSFGPANGTNSGWLAIAQPLSANATSNPAGRIWVNFTGNFTVNSDGTHQASSTPADAPTTWLNALAQSNFSPDSPNLPLLGDATYPSNTGGLLIQADPTVGWGNNFGQTMLAADVNNDGIQDLVIAAPQANGGGRVYIISGEWIQAQLTTADGGAILDLANPNNLGDYVTVLTAGAADSADNITVAGFGTALAYDTTTDTLWIGAPNYLRILDSNNKQDSLQPIGALYGYNYSNLSSAWGTGQTTALANPILGSGGTVTTLDPSNTQVTTYWGSQFGTAIATNSDGAIAISAPGFYASMIYSGTSEVGQRATIGGNKNTSTFGDGALLKIQLPDSSSNVAIASGASDATFVDIANQDIGKKSGFAKEESAYMQNLKALQVDNIADATEFYNQAFQTDSVGAVYLFSTSTDLQSIANSNTSSTTFGAELVANASGGGATFYGPNPWNVLGASGFGSSLALSDLKNTNSSSTLAIGASQTGGSGALYLVDTQQAFTKPQTSQPEWLNNINTFGSNQYLAHLASSTTLYGAASMDNFANGLVNLGDVNADGYDDLLIQAFNASSGAGNGYVLFGSDQVMPTTTGGTPNPATGSVAPGSIGSFLRADGTSFTNAILSELGNGSSAYTGQGSFGAGDVNSDGLNDIPLGSGPNGSSYLTWGHAYLESITNFQLDKLASNTGYLLDGLATTTQGSLRSIGDFNGDGYGDFMSINPGNALTTVRIELGANTQEILADYPYNFYTFTVANGTEVLPGGDINGDGMDDIVLFIDQNLPCTVGQVNLGAGSTTGILYGRTSNDLPVGAGFGFIAPVDPTTSAPPAPLPGLQISNGLTNVAPAVINVGNTIYSVVKGWDNNSLYFAQSSDGGSSWSGWTDLTLISPAFASNTGPSLAFYNEKLYLAFLNTSGTLSLSSWDPTSQSAVGWSTPAAITDTDNAYFSSNYSPQLIERGDALGIIWVDASKGTVSSSYSTRPNQSTTTGSWAAPTELLQRLENSSGVSFVPISATEAPSATWLGGVPTLALNNNGTINVYAGLQSGVTHELTSSFSATSSDQSISSGPVLTSTPTGLALTYTNSDDSITLQRLNFTSANGNTLPGVQFNPDGSIDTSKADLQWQSTTLTAANSGISTDLATVPLSVDGTLLLTNVRNGNNQIWLNAVPNLADPASTTWLNTTIQLGTNLGTTGGTQNLGQLAGSQNTVGSFSPGNWSSSISGQTPAQASVAYGSDTVYIAVTGTPSTTGSGKKESTQYTLYYNSSSDNGTTWGSWAALNSSCQSNQQPSIAYLGGNLYLCYIAYGSGNLDMVYSSDGGSSWSSAVTVVNKATSASMIVEGDNLAIYYTNNDSDILKIFTSTPSSNDGWSTADVNYGDSLSQTASGQLALTRFNGQTYLAYQGGTSGSPSNDIYISTATDTVANSTSSSNWTWLSTPTGISPSQNGIGLTSNAQGLILTYTDTSATDEVSIQMSNSDVSSWVSQQNSETLASDVGYTPLITSSTTTPLLIVGVSTTSNDINVQQNQIPIVLSADTTGSSISALGDINGDGFDDLAITANNVVYSPSADFSSSDNQLTTGMRIVLGKATATDFSSANNANADQQTVQIADLYPQPSSSQASSTFTPVANLSGPTTLILNGALSASSYQITSTAGSASGSTLNINDITASGSTLSSLQQLFSGATTTSKPIPTWHSAAGTGSPALQTHSGYGDLNADGYVDYLAPDGLNNVYSSDGAIGYDVWSIRAAGDVNGNGFDDLLLTLSPAETAGQWLQTVLVDGALFHVKNNQFSLAKVAGSAQSTWSSAGLKEGLDPYQYAYSVNTPKGLQQWVQPILDYQPTNTISSFSTSSTNNASLTITGGGAETAVSCISPDGTTYITTSGIGGIDVSYGFAGSPASSWSTVELDFNTLAPSGGSVYSTAIYDNKIFILYNNYYLNVNQISISWADLSSDLSEAASWSTYVPQGVSSSKLYSGQLVNEGDRLALYFNAFPASGSTNTSYPGASINVTYSSDPSSSTSWGSTQDGTGFTGSPSAVQAQSSGDSTATAIVATNFAATRFQGQTILAYYSSDYTTSSYALYAAQATSASPGTLFSTQSTTFGVKPADSNPVSYPPTLNLSASASQVYLMNAENISMASFGGQGAASALEFSSQTSVGNLGAAIPFVSQSDLYLAYLPTMKGLGIVLADLTQPAPSQVSLAGYSLDGNVDVNGDGFADILISDPSDPSQGVDSQYVLFGGDYLNIASQVGTAGNDTLIGTPLADVIYSISGADEVFSSGGADVIYTGSGNDQISILDNTFVRIDAGSGFDELLLQGQSDQAYNFALNIATPQYFAGTKLKDIELISSVDYGSNTLSFDAAAINAINPDRILFLTPDNSDLIALSSEFQRNSTFDTNFGGVLWSAYASGEQASSTSDSPALVYVLNPDGATNANWLSTNVSTTDASSTSLRAASTATLGVPDSSSESSIPTSSGVQQTVPFGSGLSLTSYRTNPSDAEARFSVSSSDTSKPRALLYAISSANSSAEPGRHYTAIAGVAVLAKGQSSFDITVPINGEAFSQLRNGTLSLLVEEIPYSDRLVPLHLLIDPATSAEGDAGLPPVLSGFSLNPDTNGSTATLGFRADTNDGSADALKLSIARRSSADASSSIAIVQHSIRDATTESSSSNNALIGFDQDNLDNGQVAFKLQLNLKPQPSEAYLSFLRSNDTALDLIELGQKPSLIAPFSTISKIDYDLINSGLADFSTLSKKQIGRIDWSSVDFESVAQSPDSRATLNAATINYKKLESNDFQALSSFINVDQLTGANIRTISKNSAADTYMNVEFIGPGQLQSFNGSDAIDLIYLRRGAAEITASGGAGDDLFYINSKRSEITITDFSEGDALNLSSFQNRAILNGKLSFVQYGDDIRFTYNNRTVATLLDVDIDKLSRNGLTFMIQTSDPLA